MYVFNPRYYSVAFSKKCEIKIIKEIGPLPKLRIRQYMHLK